MKIFVAILWLFLALFYTVSCHKPAGRWTYREKDGGLVHVLDTQWMRRNEIPSEVQELKRASGCDCMCRRAWEDTWYCCECGDTTCFPGNASVTLDDGNIIKVDQLKYGHRVLTVNQQGQVISTPFLGYLDHRSDVISQYHVIETASGARLILSGSHILYVKNNATDDMAPSYARDVKRGDSVLSYNKGHDVIITMVTQVHLDGMKGAFVPLTEAGTLLVDNVLTSCYASFPHDVAHVAMAPLRWLPSLLSLTPEEGVHPYVALMKVLGRGLLPTNWLSSSKTQHLATFQETESAWNTLINKESGHSEL